MKLRDTFLAPYKEKPEPFNTLGSFVYYRTYSRYLPEEHRRERWWETVKRVVEYNTSLAPTTEEEAETLYDNIFHLRQLPSGRTLWTGGTKASQLYPLSNFNCAFLVLDSIDAFADIFYLLLVGAGVGIRILEEDIASLPSVKDVEVIHRPYVGVLPHERREYSVFTVNSDHEATIVIGDSKEGWTTALTWYLNVRFGMKENIRRLVFDYSNIRPHGERLRTFGGYASGHESMRRMIEGIEAVFSRSCGQSLRPVDVMDIANYIAQNVVSGGTRRSSEMILFSPDDEDIKQAKSHLYTKQEDGTWTFNEALSQRTMSNNSVFYQEKPTLEAWKHHMKCMRTSGEPGFVNAQAGKKRRDHFQGVNPCGEILLDDKQVCNLAEVNLLAFVDENGHVDMEGLYEAQRLSARLAYRMACVTLELPAWNEKNRRDRLVGCSITGVQDFFNQARITSREERISLYKTLRYIAETACAELAEELHQQPPVLVTTCKPSGTASQVYGGVSSGIHYAHAPYYLRRIRISASDPLLRVARALHYPVFPEVGQREETADTFVIEFPCKSPKGRCKNDVTAEEQFQDYLDVVTHYATHNASNTITVRNDEWDDLAEAVYRHWDDVVSMSFLPQDDSFYQLMPYEEITEEEYLRRKSTMKPFDPSLIALYEKDYEEYDLGSDCDGGLCPIR